MKSDAQYGSAKLQPGSNRNPYHYDPEKAQQEAADREAMPQRLADALSGIMSFVMDDYYPDDATDALKTAVREANSALAAYAAIKEDK